MQSEWNTLQLAQMRMTHQQEKDRTQRKSKRDSATAGGEGSSRDDRGEKGRGRIMKPVSSRVPSRKGDAGEVEHKAEWDEV